MDPTAARAPDPGPGPGLIAGVGGRHKERGEQLIPLGGVLDAGAQRCGAGLRVGEARAERGGLVPGCYNAG